MRKLKNIYLVGPSRCGKTTTASFLQQEYGYTHIIMDAVIETMRDFAPQLGINFGNLDSEDFRRFLSTYSSHLFKYTKHNIIDLAVLSPSYAKTIINDDESVVIYMGYPSITAEDKMQQMRKYDSEFDWTRTLSNEELIKFLEIKIQQSKQLQQEAIEYGFEFIDTSFNREEVIRKSLERIINEGKLDRTEESYKRYYR